jgi:hypothetical protein
MYWVNHLLPHDGAASRRRTPPPSTFNERRRRRFLLIGAPPPSKLDRRDAAGTIRSAQTSNLDHQASLFCNFFNIVGYLHEL